MDRTTRGRPRHHYLLTAPLFGFFIAQIPSDLTMQQLGASIHGPENLSGKRVAVVKGSTSAEYVRLLAAVLYEYDQVEEC